jgi:GT2 family glycosyltransferase
VTSKPEIDISVVIVNWNGAQILPRCLEALAGQTFRNFEIIIVDNGSQDGSVEGLEGQHPNLRVIRLGENLGFTTANNRGAQCARGRWLVFLNNDAFPSPAWLSALFDAATHNPAYSSFASKMIQANRPDLMDGAGIVFHTSGLSWNRGFNQPDGKEYQESCEVFGACAAASMIETSIFLSLGGFDEDYFIYHDDTDLAFRLQLVGRRCLYVADAVVTHLGSQTTGIESNFSVYYQQRNWLWTYWKDMPGSLLWRSFLIHIFTNLVFGVFYLTRRRTISFTRAKLHAIMGLPAVIRKRRLSQKGLTQMHVPAPAASIQGINPVQDDAAHKHEQSMSGWSTQGQAAVNRISALMDHGWFTPFQLGKKYSRYVAFKKRYSGS